MSRRHGRMALATMIAVAAFVSIGNAKPLSATDGEASEPDFNGDGFDDLAVGVPHEGVVRPGGSSLSTAGAVQVVYGSANGLSSFDQVWHQGAPGLAGSLEAGDNFGSALAWGDFNGDGFDDLAIGSLGENIEGSQPVDNAGAVNVLFGSASGLTSAASLFIRVDTLGTQPQQSEWFGAELAAGDLGRGPEDDLAIAAPRRPVAGQSLAGAVWTLYGSPGGPSTSGAQMWTQGATASAPLAGLAEPGDQLGWELEVGSFGGSPHALVIGVPYEDVGGFENAGAINIVTGSASGLSATGNRFLSQEGTAVPGDPRARQYFGFALAAADFGKTSEQDLAIGAPGDQVSTPGDVVVLYGAPKGGLSTAGAQRFTRGQFGVVGSEGGGVTFGFSLAAANFGKTPHNDLAIGSPLENVPQAAGKQHGAVIVMYGDTGGLSTAGAQKFSQLGEIEGSPEAFDRFGYALSGGTYGRSIEADLAIATPEEDLTIGGTEFANAGFVNVLYATSGGLSTVNDVGLRQGGGGLAETAEQSDMFGRVLE